MAKRGDVVLYRRKGRIYNALVDSLSAPNDQLLGAGGESVLNLWIIADYPANAFQPHPAPKGTLKLGYTQEPEIVYDVPHASANIEEHAWSECPKPVITLDSSGFVSASVPVEIVYADRGETSDETDPNLSVQEPSNANR
jgi:hypothetical protein